MKRGYSNQENDEQNAENISFNKDLEFVLNYIDVHFPILSHVDTNRSLEEKLELALAISNFLLRNDDWDVDLEKYAMERIHDDLLKDDDQNHVQKVPIINVVVGSKDSKKSLGAIPNVTNTVKLEALGCKLFDLFSGENSYSQSITNGKDSTKCFSVINQPEESRSFSLMKKRYPTYEALNYLDVPTSLCSMISTLIGSDDNIIYRYESISEVSHDLEAIIKDPQRFMCKPSLERLNGQLEFPNKRIYGRSEETKVLFEVYQRVFSVNRTSEIALVSGYPGVGKSSIVHQIKDLVSDSGCYFLIGKFEQLTNSNPLSALISAFNDYCGLLLQRNPSDIESIKSEIRQSLDSGCKVLTDLIPGLIEVIGEPELSPISIEGDMVVNRRNHLFRSFLNVISSHCRIILFLDDLQWADSETLNVLQTLISTRNESPILMIGCYRDNEDINDLPLIDYIHHMKQSKTPLTTIKLKNLGKDDTNDLLSEILCMPPTITRALTPIVHRKTSGNPMFVVEFMKSLFCDKMLTFSLKTRQWDWNIRQIESKLPADNVVELLKDKMLKLPQMVQESLKIASCLGSSSQQSTFGHISSLLGVDKSTFLEYLDYAVDEGLMGFDGENYRFVHDQIESAAYALISDADQPSMHLKIGKLLLTSTNGNEVASAFCEAVSQMNRGIILLKSNEERTNLAKLNLKAGKVSSTTRSFSTAWFFFEKGLSLLDDDDWKNNYQLILELTNYSLESAYIFGDYETLGKTVRRVITKAVNFDDKLRAYYCSIKALGSSHKMPEALDVGFTVLDELGVTFPSVIDEAFLRRERHLTCLALDGFTEEELLYLPELTDGKMIMAMKIMDRLFHIGFFLNVFEMIVLRFIRISTGKGVCSDSPFGFCCYGLVLCSRGDFAKGYRFGQIARKLVGRFNATSAFSKVTGIGCSLINVWNEPIELCLQPCLDSCEVAMIVGDVQFTAINMTHYTVLSVLCGSKLPPLLRQIYVFLGRMSETKQELFYAVTSFYSQAISKLVKGFKAKKTINVEIQEMQDSLPPIVRSTPFLFLEAHTTFLWLNYLFGRYDAAAKNLTIIENNATGNQLSVRDIFTAFWGCLNTLTLARKSVGHKRVNLQQKADKYIQKMKTWSSACEWNFQHKYHLLNAEWLWTAKDIKSALSEFDVAAENASKHRAMHDEALIHERAGFLECLHNPSSAKARFVRAKDLYIQWGSKTKADHIQSQLASLNLS